MPGQALYLLNSVFVRKQSLALAERLLAGKGTDTDRVRTAYRLALGRTPGEAEVGRALAFVAEYESVAREFYPDNLAPPPRLARRAKATADDPAEPPPDPDQIDQTGVAATEESVHAPDARTAAWMALAQALFGSAEFRYVR